MKNIVNLGNVATYINGYAFKPSDWAEDGTPIIRIQDLTGNSYQMNRFKGIVDSKYEVNNGDVLISWSASLGVYIWNRGDAVLNQHIFKVVFDKVELDKDFFVFQVDNLLKRAANQAHGATMRHLTKPVFDALPFYLPDIKTQRLISSKFNLIGHLIEDHHNQLKKLDELIRSRFLELFGDPIVNSLKLPCKKLSALCDLKAGIFTSASEIHEFQSAKNPYPCYGGNGIRGFVDNYTQEGKFPIIGRQGALCGNVQLATGKFRNTEHAVVVKPKVNLNVIWLYEALILENLNRLHTGAAQPGLSVNTLNQINIPVPSIIEQDKYEHLFIQLDKSKYRGTISLHLLEDVSHML